MALLGEQIPDYVKNQIKVRQASYGSGISSDLLRTDETLLYANARNAYASADTGTGIMPPSSFGEMPANFDWKSALGAMQALGGLMGQPEQQAPMPQMELTPMQASQLPMGSNQSYEDLLKMYGVRTGGLLG